MYNSLFRWYRCCFNIVYDELPDPWLGFERKSWESTARRMHDLSAFIRLMDTTSTVSRSGLRVWLCSLSRGTSPTSRSNIDSACAASLILAMRRSFGSHSCKCSSAFTGPPQIEPSFCSFFFFGGLSIHLSQALLAHMFSYNITWGATKKEVENSNFWLEVPKILKRFWFALVLSLGQCFLMIILSTDAVPVGWQIPGSDWSVILPLA